MIDQRRLKIFLATVDVTATLASRLHQDNTERVLWLLADNMLQNAMAAPNAASRELHLEALGGVIARLALGDYQP